MKTLDGDSTIPRDEKFFVEVARYILDALYPDGDHLLSSFLYGPPGSTQRERRIVANIFVRDDKYIKALLFIRQHGASFLKDISMTSLHSKVTNFVTEHYAYITDGRLHLSPGKSLYDQISAQGLVALSQALMRSVLFTPTNNVTLYPLVTVIAQDPYQSKHFSLVNSEGLAESLANFDSQVTCLWPTQFPPMAGAQMKQWPTQNWLCVNAPDPLIARKRASAILGGVALTPIRRERYTQTGRSVHGGYCTISSTTISTSPGTQPMTPRISSDIKLTEVDWPWLDILSTLFDSSELAKKSSVRALEYFHRAWFEDPRERFPTLCMSLDSLVAADRGYTKAVVDFVKSIIDEPIDQERLRLLMGLRGAVIHGAAPDVYESDYYETYYSEYGEDPIRDIELIVAHCLRQRIFNGKLATHPDPHAELIRQQQNLGRLPRNRHDRTIISDD